MGGPLLGSSGINTQIQNTQLHMNTNTQLHKCKNTYMSTIWGWFWFIPVEQEGDRQMRDEMI